MIGRAQREQNWFVGRSTPFGVAFTCWSGSLATAQNRCSIVGYATVCGLKWLDEPPVHGEEAAGFFVRKLPVDGLGQVQVMIGSQAAEAIVLGLGLPGSEPLTSLTESHPPFDDVPCDVVNRAAALKCCGPQPGKTVRRRSAHLRSDHPARLVDHEPVKRTSWSTSVCRDSGETPELPAGPAAARRALVNRALAAAPR